MPEKLEMRTKDIMGENVAKIALLFPNCVVESLKDGKPVKSIDFDALRQELSDYVVDGPTERYQLTWPDKSKAKLLANLPINMTLRPCPEESVDFDNTKNIYIEGDNLDVLKLLRETYLGKVKMIYIDPPYNTGNDFVYDDDFRIDAKGYAKISGDYDGEGNRIVPNFSSNGRFHTDWLNMIYPRLKISRDLLKANGAIFISIDDNEIDNLRKICNEIFGSQNFIANIVWQKKYGPANDAKTVSTTHEYIVIYAKDYLQWDMGLFNREAEQLKAYKNPDDDPRGPWRASDLSARTYSKLCDYPINGPTGIAFNPPASRSWIVNRLRYNELLKDNRITFGVNNIGRPMQKKFLSEVRQGITPETWWGRGSAGDNKVAKYELKEIFPENVFETPKPTKLIKKIIQVANVCDDDIVLDYFAGSSTTAHSVLLSNVTDGKKRRFILIQMPESCSDDSVALKSGYMNVCEIGKERIRRVGKKIQSANAQSTLDGKNRIDTGFRVLKLDSTNMKDVYYSPEQTFQSGLDDLLDNIKGDRKPQDLLFQCMLDLGIELSVPIDLIKIDGKDVYDVDNGYLLACFDTNVTEPVVTEIAKKKPVFAVMRDSSMSSDSTATNFEQIFKSYSPTTERKVF